MGSFVQGWGFVVTALILITGVFGFALYSLDRELRHVKELTDHLSYDIMSTNDAGVERPAPTLEGDQIRDEIKSVTSFKDPGWANKQIRGWEMRSQRLEPALAFWVDFLRQLGLLFTVLGLGLSLAVERGNVEQLLAPLGLAVWTTVAGLAYSVWLTAQFGMKIPVWADTCEKNIEAWRTKRGHNT